VKKLLKRIDIIKKYFFKNDNFPYPAEDLDLMIEQSKDKKHTIDVIKKELYRYWDFIAGLALGGILNYLYDDEKIEDIKEGLSDQGIPSLHNINMEEFEGLNKTYIVFETTRTMLNDLIEDYENNSL